MQPHLWRQPRLADVARLRTLNVLPVTEQRYYFCPQLQRALCSRSESGHVTTSWAPLGPGARAGLPPVAIDRSSRKRYHSRYNLREKMLKTRS